MAAKLDLDVQRLELHCATLDFQIDEAVYELYGLAEEEIKIVEGKRSWMRTIQRRSKC